MCERPALVLIAAAVISACGGGVETLEGHRTAGREALRQDDLAGAEVHFQAALKLAEKPDGSAKAIAAALDDLTQLYIAREDLPRAEGFSRRALAVREKALGAGDRAITRTVDRLGWLALKQDRLDEAAALYERSMLAQEKTFGRMHEETADALDRLANVYSRQKQFDAAVKTYGRSVAIREAHFGPRHVELAAALERVASVHLAADRPGEAEALLLRAVAIRESGAIDAREVAETRRRLALAHSAQAEFTEAETSLQRALTVLEQAPAKEAQQGGLLRMVLENYAGLLLQTGRREEADRMKERAKAVRAQARNTAAD